MSDERPTVRPVTLSRMAELTHACEAVSKSTVDLEDELEVSHRRARETILEAKRISLLDEDDSGEEPVYTTTDVGLSFLSAIRDEDWSQVSTILETRSPPLRDIHRGSRKRRKRWFRHTLDSIGRGTRVQPIFI